MLETDKTVLDVSRGQKRPPSERWIIWVAGLAFVMLCGALVLANFRNAALKKKEAQIEEVAAKRALEIKRLTEQHPTVATPPPVAATMPPFIVKTYPSGSPDSGTENDPSEDDESIADQPIDGSVPHKPTEKW